MLAFVILFLAALSRIFHIFPNALHNVGINFTAVGAGLLFFGSRRPRWQATIAAAVMALTDVYLTKFVYGLPFHVRGYLMTWVWYAGVCLMASGLLRKVTPLRVAVAVLASATGFFIWVDFAVWAFSGMYPHSVAGLMSCYVAAVPFYGNDLLSTALFAAALFGLPVLAARLAPNLRGAQMHHQPLV